MMKSKGEKAFGGGIVAFVDIGTNAVRMLLVHINPDLSYSILSQRKETVRLGEGAYLRRKLNHEAMDRTILVCRQFVEMARSKGAKEIIAVATSATRQAKNRRRLQERLLEEAELEMEIISGLEEARTIYLGISRGFHMGSSNGIFIDIGGGSTEIIVGDQQQYHYLASLPLGHIRLSNRFLRAETGPLERKRFQRLKRYVRDAAVREIQAIRAGWDGKLALAIGSSGTIETLAAIAIRQSGSETKLDTVLTFEDLQKVNSHLCALPLDERRNVPGINKQRADVILGGAAILECLMQDLKISQIHVSKRGLRDGLLEHYLDQIRPPDHSSSRSVRADSVLRLGRALRFDEEHARRVTQIALSLFDSAKAAGLHTLEEHERDLLEHAALLHDIGIVLSYKGHQEHSAYFIRNADLPGFNQREIAIMATIVRFHRKSFPRKKHAPFDVLESTDQCIVRTLGVLLSMAESLDRSHAGLIQRVELRLSNAGEALLHLHCSQECPLELWGVAYHSRAFQRVFDRPLQVEMVKS